MKIGFLQLNVEFGNKEKNVKHAVDYLLNSPDADIIVLPELFNTGYNFVSKDEVEQLSENVDNGYTISEMISVAKKRNFYISFGFAERKGDKIYNSSALVGPDGLVGTYHKLHLFFEEKKWFAPGEKLPEIFTINGVKVGMMICFDWIFPEVARSIALKGGQIILHSANLVLPYCQNAMITRSIENRIFTVTANRIGREKRGSNDFTFTGMSQITDTKGKRLYSAEKDTEELIVVEINPEEANNKLLNEYNNILSDRRVDVFKEILC